MLDQLSSQSAAFAEKSKTTVYPFSALYRRIRPFQHGGYPDIKKHPSLFYELSRFHPFPGPQPQP